MKNRSVKMIWKIWSLEGKGKFILLPGRWRLVAKSVKRAVYEQLIRTGATTAGSVSIINKCNKDNHL